MEGITYFYPYKFLLVVSFSECFFLIYYISISILCISQKGLTFIESNQQICDFYENKVIQK